MAKVTKNGKGNVHRAQVSVESIELEQPLTLSRTAEFIQKVMLQRDTLVENLAKVGEIIGEKKAETSDLNTLIDDIVNGDGSNSLSWLFEVYLTEDPSPTETKEGGELAAVGMEGGAA